MFGLWKRKSPMSASQSEAAGQDREPRAYPEGYSPIFDKGFNAYVGPIMRKAAGTDGPSGREDHYLLHARPEHLNGAKSVHGGMLMAMSDVVLGSTVAHAIDLSPCSTISLSCDFVAAGKLGDTIEGRARVTRRTRSVVFVAGELYVTQEDGSIRTLMTATGIWKILGQ